MANDDDIVQVDDAAEADTTLTLACDSSSSSSSSSSFCSSMDVLFADRDRAFGCIAVLTNFDNNNNHDNINNDNHDKNDNLYENDRNGKIITEFDAPTCQEALASFRRILEKYRECPCLLDPSMESMVTSISGKAISILLQLLQLQQQDQNNVTQEEEDESFEQRDRRRLEFTFCHTSLPYLLSALYALSTIRGRKIVQRFLPHEVDHVVPILMTLDHVDNKMLLSSHGQNRGSTTMSPHDNDGDTRMPPRWESLYTLWSWMGMLSLVPFSVHVFMASNSVESLSSTIPSKMMCDMQQRQQPPLPPLVLLLFHLAKQHLSHAGSHQEMAAACLASWLSRPDLRSMLVSFVDWTQQDVLGAFLCSYDNNDKDDNRRIVGQQRPTIYLILGVLRTIVTILKLARCDMDQLESIKTQLWDPMMCLTDRIVANGNNTMIPNNNIVLRKLVVKWWSRVAACVLVPPRPQAAAAASWRYQRGRRTLLENVTTQRLQQPQQLNTVSIKDNGSRHELEQEECEHDVFFAIPEDELEVTMGYLIEAITDSSTVVRWSAAKGVGRLTERLPTLCAMDVMDAVLALCRDPDHHQAWHGACLTLAELARRGLLLPRFLPDVVPLIVTAIQYDIQRGNISVGSAVRDAACYTYWAFARAYQPDVLRPFIRELSQSVVVTSLFDREVNCRRAASAAFQECVGRQGANNFTHGIDILTVADYFSLGNRQDAYTTIAFQVAQFEEYRRPIFEHLYKIKLRHWDIAIRKLSADALRCLTPLDVTVVCDEIIPVLLTSSLDPNLAVRHGAVLGIAEILLALGDRARDESSGLAAFLDGERCSSIAELVPSIEKHRLYRGRGGEIMRSAACRLIECLSLSKLPLQVKQQVRLLDSLDACLPHPSEDIQKSAAQALHALMRSYFPVGPNGPSERLQKRVVDKYVNGLTTEDNPAATRGFALALGSLPKKLLAPSEAVLDSVMNSLCLVSRSTATVGNHKDAATRRNAITSLTRICQTVSTAPQLDDDVCVVHINSEQLQRVSDTFFLALDDYSTDHRGDVGSWSRIAAMHGLEQIAYILISSSNHMLDDGWFSRLVGNLLKQLAEKLNMVRNEAGQCLARIITKCNPPIPQMNFLVDALRLPNGNEVTIPVERNWSDAAITFSLVMRTAHIDEFFDYVIAGVVISVGGLTEAVTKHSSAAFLQFVKELKETGSIEKLGNALLRLFKQNTRETRVILPLLKTLDLLLSRRCFDELIIANPEFGLCLVEFLTLEEANCSDVELLFAIVRVALGLLAASRCRKLDHAVCKLACKMLSHHFPRVRRYAAENLYVLLLERSDLVDDIENCGKLLVEAPWDANLNGRQINKMALKVRAALGQLEPVNSYPLEDTQKVIEPVTDEFTSFSSLVRNLEQ